MKALYICKEIKEDMFGKALYIVVVLVAIPPRKV